MTRSISRRKLLRAGGGVITTAGLSALPATFMSETARAQSLPLRRIGDDYEEDLFYREDWLGEPWRKPDPALLIHGNDESSVEWYAWIPPMAQEYRLVPPGAPGMGHSKIPRGFEYYLGNLPLFIHK